MLQKVCHVPLKQLLCQLWIWKLEPSWHLIQQLPRWKLPDWRQQKPHQDNSCSISRRRGRCLWKYGGKKNVIFDDYEVMHKFLLLLRTCTSHASCCSAERIRSGLRGSQRQSNIIGMSNYLVKVTNIILMMIFPSMMYWPQRSSQNSDNAKLFKILLLTKYRIFLPGAFLRPPRTALLLTIDKLDWKRLLTLVARVGEKKLLMLDIIVKKDALSWRCNLFVRFRSCVCIWQ